jgi:hypothetical protein
VSDVVDGPAVAAAEVEAVPYVVQVRERARPEGWDGQPVEMWRDIATISVSPRTKRRTVVERALRESPDEIGASEGAVLRVLSPGDSKTFRVSTVRRDPELRIEGA